MSTISDQLLGAAWSALALPTSALGGIEFADAGALPSFYPVSDLAAASVGAAALAVRKRATAGMLAAELEVSYKTVCRDLEFMRDRLDLPIAADSDGFFFQHEVPLCRCCSRRVRQ